MTRYFSTPASPDNSSGNVQNLFQKSPPATTLGILSFETAKNMSHLISLYKSVTEEQVSKLKTEIIKSVGVSYLNSKDETFLLGLACSERLEELNRAADTVSRLSQKCSNCAFSRFELVHADLKQGIFDSGKVDFRAKSVDKIIEKMEKYVTSTSVLYSEMECLNEMEARDRKIQQWKRTLSLEQIKETNFELFEQKIGFQRKEVRRYKQLSLWNQTFDKCVSLMAQIVCTVYAQIISVFGPHVSGLRIVPAKKHSLRGKNNHHFHIHIHLYLHRKRQLQNRIFPETDYCIVEHRDKYASKRLSKSVPRSKNSKKASRPRFSSHELNLQFPENDLKPKPKMGQSNQVYLSAPPTTVGGSGLTLRYANVILQAEKYLHTPAAIREEERVMMYEMLPARLKATVKAKLKSNWVRREETNRVDGNSLAAGWREALEGMMEWLVPVAVDTVRWHMERNLERQRMDSKPTVLLLQTLHYSDLEKTEATIAEVLVGLSCIYKYENWNSTASTFSRNAGRGTSHDVHSYGNGGVGPIGFRL